MFDLRRDFLTGEYVAISEERAKRPSVAGDKDICPFCENNEYMTPPTKYISADNKIRVFNNRYPALPSYNQAVGGFHEVVVDTPLHGGDFTYFSPEYVTEILLVLRNRVRFMSLFDKIKYVQVFKNNGLRSGASICHSHWQIVGIPIISNRQNTIYDNQRSYYDETGRCYLCDELHGFAGVGTDELIICKNDYAVAYTPSASLYYYGVNIVTVKHISDFKDIDEKTAGGIAVVLGKSVRALKSIFSDVSYNICVINQPYTGLRQNKGQNGNPFCHFYIQIIPRIGNFAGFELSTGSYINSAFPENAASKLKNAVLTLKDYD